MQQPSHGFLDKLKARLDRNGAGKSRNSNRRSSLATATGAMVSVNVYDMLWLNVYTNSLGIGVYHTGVVIHGTEYCYGGHPFDYSGIFSMVPQDSETLGPNYSYKTTINMGWTDFTESDVSLILEDMGPQYRGDQYHLLHRNCNHFSDAFVQILCGASLPKWINRLATVGAKLPFVERSIPKMWLTPRPMEELSASQSEHSNTISDGGTCSCPMLAHTLLPSTESSPNRRRSNAFHRMHSTFSRRSHQPERPVSSVSFRGLLKNLHTSSTVGTGSLVSLAESLNTDLNLHPKNSKNSTRSSRRFPAHSRLLEGDYALDGKDHTRSPPDLADLAACEKIGHQRREHRGRGKDVSVSSVTEAHSHTEQHDSLLNHLLLPIPSLLDTHTPSLYVPSERSKGSSKTLSSTGSQNASLDYSTGVFPTGPLSPEHPIASQRSTARKLTTLQASSEAVMDQPVAQKSRHHSGRKRSKHTSPELKPRGSPNCAQTLTSSFLTRLQKLCGTSELHEPIHPSPTFDSDTNSLTNGAF